MLSVELCLATTIPQISKALIGCVILNKELVATRWARIKRDIISMIRTGTGVVECYGKSKRTNQCLSYYNNNN